MPTDFTDDALRLTLATAIGAVIGLNRDLHGKPAGLRTHALVALGSALIIVVCGRLSGAVDFHVADAQSRAIQGLITGIGFLGAGVILRKPDDGRVHGLTTAAAIWVSALFGAACGGANGLGPVAIGFALLSLVLLFGGHFEHVVHHWLKPGEANHPPQDS
jgi:putative Mg2+ transporter-C (MgtC) family protein